MAGGGEGREGGVAGGGWGHRGCRTTRVDVVGSPSPPPSRSRWAGQPGRRPQHDLHLQTRRGSSQCSTGGAGGVEEVTSGRSHLSGRDPEATPPSITSSHSGGMMILNGEQQRQRQQISAASPQMYSPRPLFTPRPPPPRQCTGFPIILHPRQAPPHRPPLTLFFFIHFHDMFCLNSSPTT